MEQCKHTYKDNKHTVSFEGDINLVYDKNFNLINSTIPAHRCSFDHYDKLAKAKIRQFNLDNLIAEDDYPASTQSIIHLLSSKSWIHLRGTESRGELVYLLRKNIKAGLIYESEMNKE